VVTDFESMAKWWIRHKSCNSVNVFYAVVMWFVWNLRNNLCFQGQCWEGMRKVMASCAKLLQNWSLVNNSDDAAQMAVWARALEARSARPDRLQWTMPDDAEGQSVSEQGDSVLVGRSSRFPDTSLSELVANACNAVVRSDTEL
jgi:hypothetical protein